MQDMATKLKREKILMQSMHSIKYLHQVQQLEINITEYFLSLIDLRELINMYLLPKSLNSF